MKKLILVSVLFIQYLFCVAQGPIITPLNSNAAIRALKTANSLKRAAGDTLKLPFFDDFTNTAAIYPDQSKWADKKVYINSHFAISPPSYGVATFDNLDAKGKPYHELSGITHGPSDSLTSRPINLKNYQSGVNTINYKIADSIFFSFFYQPQGLGDISDASDSLVLKFKDTGDNWRTVWKTSGSRTKPFKQILVGILSSKYLYNGFQFCFINFTKNTGNMNQWHLDYVRMKSGRSSKDTAVSDIAINAVPMGPLLFYETLPYNHFKANPGYNLTDSNKVYIRNNNSIGANVDYSFQARNQYNKIILDIPSSASNRNIKGQSDSSEKFIQLVLDTLSGKQPKVTLKYTVNAKSLSTDDLQNNYGGNNSNNQYIKTLQFKNYFAYDDGSAEGGFGLDYSSIPAGPGYAALKFLTFMSDTLRGISIFFNRSVADVSSKTFDLMVWKKISEPPANNMNNDIVLKRVTIASPTYMDTINGFVDYVFDTAIAIPQGSFYIGWRQVIPFILNVGYDNNYQYMKKTGYRNPNIFSNLLGYWEKVPASITGVPMMRPIMGDKVKTNIPGYVNKIVQSTLRIYPNPSNGNNQLNIESATEINSISIIDITGKEVYSVESAIINSLNISALSSGMYTILLKDRNNNRFQQKYIKTE